MNRYFLFDLIRVIAIFLVILLHVAGTNVDMFSEIPRAWWLVSNLYDSFARICVPLFFILTGALIFWDNNNPDNYKIVYRRIKKIIIPLLAWSVIYLLLNLYSAPIVPIPDFPRLILSGPVFAHLWYLYALIGLYLVIPIIQVYLNAASLKNIRYYLIIWFISSAIFPLLKKINIPIGINIEVAIGFSGFLILGYYFRKQYIENLFHINNKFIICCIIANLIGLIVTAYGTYKLTILNKGILNQFFYEYTSGNVILMTLSMIFIITYINNTYKVYAIAPIAKIIKFISPLSFGVYLVHLIILRWLNTGYLGLNLNALTFHPIISIPINTVIIFLISLAIVFVFKKIPYVRNIVP